ncbi:hypothetical protein OJ996_23540 [Luteolibacter sp. GHJ8]|uniref:Uncharacterized protein n=1 Tax=Luteolibacter rhizosphaerae TaxID=2989719 RepID=A0ABT3G9R9_9BACT|nr:hypothetical protein [Luteolibacter rhizosphaerae]MCW1916581.1 hypothetical protein [Luteolibacter rhizosphaerae]
MRRWILLTLLSLSMLASGFVLSGYLHWTRDVARRDEDEARHAEEVAGLRQRIFGDNYFHHEGLSPEMDSRLAAFDPAKDGSRLSLSYAGGMSGRELHLVLSGDGSLESEENGESERLATIPAGQCRSVFLQVLRSGFLNYSEGTVELKRELLWPGSRRSVTDNPDTVIRITAPMLEIDKTVSIYTPQVELDNYPDIIEYQIFTRIEKDMLALVPEGKSPWKESR